PGARERWEQVYDEGAETAHALLAERDPAAAAAVHPNDRRRVVRALELAESGSSLRPGEDRLWSGETRHPTLIVGLDLPVEELATQTRRYAAYQRKWLRRIPGIVLVDGNRGSAEVAQEIVTRLGSVAG